MVNYSRLLIFIMRSRDNHDTDCYQLFSLFLSEVKTVSSLPELPKRL